MKIISHRGQWLDTKEQNTINSFKQSLYNNFGIETDLRDYNGNIVVSHDMPNSNAINVELLFEEYNATGKNEILALNIKSDGLQNDIRELLNKYTINNYFFFDMSIPDMYGYMKSGLNVYTRLSEYETVPVFYNDSSGIWLDSFQSMWFNESDITHHFNKGKNVCIVSQELHGRSHIEMWKYLSSMHIIYSDKLILCTDYPAEAREFFK